MRLNDFNKNLRALQTEQERRAGVRETSARLQQPERPAGYVQEMPEVPETERLQIVHTNISRL